ncbi:MAG: hypothetical protein LBJ00_18025 [Planctomycetaceae bacterium]|nr:hypothetical protein [Planctomycetaceae bacterium]
MMFLFLLVCPVCAGCSITYDDSGKFKTEPHGTILTELPKIPEAEKPFDYQFSDDNDHRDCKFDDMMF